jgi:cation diffusion facilitator family transporter
VQAHDRSYVAARRVTWAGLVANLALAAIKIAAGIIGHSRAVIADGVHSISDLATDVAVLFGMRYWTAPADANHPHGHHRIETLVTLAIGTALFAVAGGLAWDVAHTLTVPVRNVPGPIALAAALLSIVTKESLYRWTAVVGRRVNSPALVANAWHHRSDAFSSVPAVIAVAGAMVVPRWAWLDKVGALVVCGFIVWAAWRIVSPALAELSDRGAPEDTLALLENLATQIDGVRSAHALRTRYIGPHLAVDVHVEVDGDLTVEEGFAIARRVKRRLFEEGPDVGDVVVQIEPWRGDGAAT